MTYWNQKNFEGLKQIGEKYSSIPDYETFSKYCLFKEKGIKKKAIASINKFVSDVKTKPISKQREIAKELAELAFWNGNIHQLLSYPLKTYLKQIFSNWTEENCNDSEVFRFMAFISSDYTFYEKALSINPDDEICHYKLALAHIDDVDYQTHHLSESLFLGTINDAINSLEAAKLHIEKIESDRYRIELMEEYQYSKMLIEAWVEYVELKIDISFPEWSTKKGYKFNFFSVVYYEK